MRMIFIFIDGLGIGEENENKNPVRKAHAENIRHLLENPCTIAADACLGVPGLPQSATGQTAIFTGINASSVLGRHMSGQPTQTLRNIIENSNLFKELIKMGFSVTNSNVYREEYLLKMLDPKERRCRPSVTSVMTMSAGVRFRTVEDYNWGKGIYHDVTGEVLHKSGYDVKLISVEDAAERLYSISRDYDFTLYEHFMSDIIGHTADMELAVKEVILLDTFLGKLLDKLDLDEDILMITSDHGNIEDISVKTHTFNKVPVIILGDVQEAIKLRIKSLTDIMPAVIDIFKNRRYGREADE